MNPDASNRETDITFQGRKVATLNGKGWEQLEKDNCTCVNCTVPLKGNIALASAVARHHSPPHVITRVLLRVVTYVRVHTR